MSLRPFERRAAGAYPYFRLARWNARSICWDDVKKPHPTEAAARAAVAGVGMYRISRIDESGRVDLEPFEIGSAILAEPIK